MPKNSPFFIELGQGLFMMTGLPTIVSWKTSERPKKPKVGTFGFNIETNTLEYWDGSNWYGASMSQN